MEKKKKKLIYLLFQSHELRSSIYHWRKLWCCEMSSGLLFVRLTDHFHAVALARSSVCPSSSCLVLSFSRLSHISLQIFICWLVRETWQLYQVHFHSLTLTLSFLMFSVPLFPLHENRKNVLNCEKAQLWNTHASAKLHQQQFTNTGGFNDQRDLSVQRWIILQQKSSLSFFAFLFHFLCLRPSPRFTSSLATI